MHSEFERPGVLRPRQMRGINSGIVLQLLRRFERLSRAEIARHSGLSEGTISRIVSELVRQRLVVELDFENSTGGRPATRLQLSDAPLAIGVEIQNWQTRFAVVSLRGNIVETESLRTSPGVDPTLECVISTVQSLVDRYPGGRIHGVGVTARGIVNSRSGVVEMGNAPGWAQIPLRSMLETGLTIPVYVDNDVRAAAAAEFHYTNAGEQAPNCLLYIRMDEGVGVGLVLHGKLYSGPSMSAGEFGQMVVADQGGVERHDRPGCLEKLVSNSAICERYAAVHGRRAVTPADSGARVRRLCHKALEGDAEALRVLRNASRSLGLGISNLVWGLDPEVIVLSTALNLVWPMLLEEIQKQLPEPHQWPPSRKLSLRPSVLGEDGVLIGAAELCFASLFETAQLGSNRKPVHHKALATG
jgi:predicted NBD/HSP70 family sugar kinase